MKSACDCNLFLYTDDSALLVSHHVKLEVEKLLSSELHKVSIWLAEDKLSLHHSKTELILFGSKEKLKKSPDFRVVVGVFEVTAKESVMYLGCILVFIFSNSYVE